MRRAASPRKPSLCCRAQCSKMSRKRQKLSLCCNLRTSGTSRKLGKEGLSCNRLTSRTNRRFQRPYLSYPVRSSRMSLNSYPRASWYRRKTRSCQLARPNSPVSRQRNRRNKTNGLRRRSRKWELVLSSTSGFVKTSTVGVGIFVQRADTA